MAGAITSPWPLADRISSQRTALSNVGRFVVRSWNIWRWKLAHYWRTYSEHK
jgi:hypothetical protein